MSGSAHLNDPILLVARAYFGQEGVKAALAFREAMDKLHTMPMAPRTPEEMEALTQSILELAVRGDRSPVDVAEMVFDVCASQHVSPQKATEAIDL